MNKFVQKWDKVLYNMNIFIYLGNLFSDIFIPFQTYFFINLNIMLFIKAT